VSDGRSLARKNGPRDVPPRMKMEGMARCIRCPDYTINA
jgi:hypothetical protein